MSRDGTQLPKVGLRPRQRTEQSTAGLHPLQRLPGVHIEEHDLYVLGVGFSTRGLASSGGPVSVVAGARTLTVHRVAALGRGTALDVEVSGVVPGPGSSRGIGFDVTLRADGQVHVAGRGHGPVHNRRDDGRITVRAAAHLGPLRPDLAEVEVIVGGTQIGGELHALVPLAPGVEGGLMATRLTGAAATVGGVTVSVPRAVLGTDPTVLLLEVRTPPPHGHVWIGARIAVRFRGEELTLLDADGREYLEEPTVVGFSHDPAVLGDVAIFPRLPPDAAGLRLVVPTVTVAAYEGEAELQVPLAGVRPGGAVPLGLDLAFGGDPLRVVAAELWELETGRLLTLRLDLGPRRHGRLLLGPGQVRRRPWLPRTLVRSRARTLRDSRRAPAGRDAGRGVDHPSAAEGGDPGAMDRPARVLTAVAAAPAGCRCRSLAVSDVLCG